MSTIVIIGSIVSSLCSISIVAVMVFLYFKATEGSREWQCIETKPETEYVIGRLTENGDSECMYNPDGVGCYVITPSKPFDQAKLDTECKNFIKNYPTVTPADATAPVALGPYTCGESPSTNYSLWSVTGYEDPESTCSKIYNERNVVPEVQKYIGSLFS
jgi:hypothetical protein